MKELCILLDEERRKMHELAEQWKQFGTTTIHKLECQIVDYQEKLIELEQRQMLLLNENQSLKSHIDQMIIKTTPDVIPFLFIEINFFFFLPRKNLNKIFQLKSIWKNKNQLIILVFIVQNQFMIIYLEQHQKLQTIN